MYRMIVPFLLTAALLTITSPGRAETIYGYSINDKQVFSFDSATPGALFNAHPVVVADTIQAIALRPANQQLYAVGVNRIYALDPLTGLTTQVSTSSIPYGLGGPFGASFDVGTDRLRVVWRGSQSSSTNSNIEINVDNGQAVQYSSLVYAPGSGSGPPTYISDIAYGTTGQLYGLDANPASYTLDTIDGDTGLVRRVGLLGNGAAGSGASMTISPLTGIAYAELYTVTSGVINASLYTISLQTGQGSLVGRIGGGELSLSGSVYLATAPVPEPRTLLLVTCSMAVLGLLSWRRSRATNCKDPRATSAPSHAVFLGGRREHACGSLAPTQGDGFSILESMLNVASLSIQKVKEE